MPAPLRQGAAQGVRDWGNGSREACRHVAVVGLGGSRRVAIGQHIPGQHRECRTLCEHALRQQELTGTRLGHGAFQPFGVGLGHILRACGGVVVLGTGGSLQRLAFPTPTPKMTSASMSPYRLNASGAACSGVVSSVRLQGL